MRIEVSQLNKSFGAYQAAKNITFQIDDGLLVGMLGPSGGGKTTLLRMLAGLQLQDSGTIAFDGRIIDHALPQERGIGFVFQNYALFKHMSVYENIAFGLKVKKMAKSEINKRVKELLELTGLEGLEHRLPSQLSGGQRQRVAFARALAPYPQLLLLDEPFAAIDAKVRKGLRSWLKDMIRRVGITTIFVTHDQEEAIEVADQIMIINEGRLEQKGSPFQIYEHPSSPFVAQFIGESNRLHDLNCLRGFEQVLPAREDDISFVRPEHIFIARREELSSLHAAQSAVVHEVFFRGGRWMIILKIGEAELFGYRSQDKPPLSPGEKVYVQITQALRFQDGHAGIVKNHLLENTAVLNSVFS